MSTVAQYRRGIVRSLTSDSVAYARRVRAIEALFAILTVAAIFLPTPSASRLSLAVPLSLLFAPVMARSLRSVKRASVITILIIATYLVGYPLGTVAQITDSARNFDSAYWVEQTFALISLAAAFAATTWCASLNGLRVTAFAAGLSAAATGVLLATPTQSDNLWKYALAWPISVLVATLLSRAPTIVGVCSMIALGVLCLRLDSRNAAGALLLAVLIVLLRRFPRVRASRTRAVLGITSIAAAAFGAIWILTTLIGRGVFGSALAQRQATQETIWLFGGRVEPFATFGYFLRSPLGYGIGTTTSPRDQQTAFNWLNHATSNLNFAYVDERLVSPTVNLHSIAATLWYIGGPVGVAAAILAAMTLVVGTLRSRQELLLVAFVSAQALWDLCFSPLDANGRMFGVALGIALISGFRPGHVDSLSRSLETKSKIR